MSALDIKKLTKKELEIFIHAKEYKVPKDAKTKKDLIEYIRREGLATRNKKKNKYEPDELVLKAYEYLETLKHTKMFNGEEETIYTPATYVGFAVFLKTNGGYFNELDKIKYSLTLKTIEDIFENHNIKYISTGDVKTSFGIFLMKNKFGYTDKQEISQNINAKVEDNTKEKILEALTKED